MAIQQFPVSGSVRSRSGLALVMDGTLRIGPLIPIPQLLREMTVDPIDVMREAGIDPALFEDPLDTLDAGSLCALGGGLPLPVRNALTHFREELAPLFAPREPAMAGSAPAGSLEPENIVR